MAGHLIVRCLGPRCRRAPGFSSDGGVTGARLSCSGRCQGRKSPGVAPAPVEISGQGTSERCGHRSPTQPQRVPPEACQKHVGVNQACGPLSGSRGAGGRRCGGLEFCSPLGQDTLPVAPEGLFFVPTAGVCPHVCVCVCGHLCIHMHESIQEWASDYVSPREHLRVAGALCAHTHPCAFLGTCARMCAYVPDCTCASVCARAHVLSLGGRVCAGLDLGPSVSSRGVCIHPPVLGQWH